jgi:hypothetical protein
MNETDKWCFGCCRVIGGDTSVGTDEEEDKVSMKSMPTTVQTVLSAGIPPAAPYVHPEYDPRRCPYIAKGRCFRDDEFHTGDCNGDSDDGYEDYGWKDTNKFTKTGKINTVLNCIRRKK